jgi:D-alanyl-D-alanine carboxypeptidase/D-alanyl-D-alanine-endopeptidase (penicillin-binding protein 4)
VAFARQGRASYPDAKKFEKTFLAEVGIPPNAANFEDGSGLSRINLVSPRAVVQLLCFMAQHPHAGVFRDSLAVAGVDGTLARRGGRRAFNRVRAKTGQLSIASCLSGYAQTRSGQTLAFSILANDCAGRNGDACHVQDLIAGWLASTRL